MVFPRQYRGRVFRTAPITLFEFQLPQQTGCGGQYCIARNVAEVSVGLWIAPKKFLRESSGIDIMRSIMARSIGSQTICSIECYFPNSIFALSPRI